MTLSSLVERYARAHLGAAATALAVTLWYVLRAVEGTSVTPERVLFNVVYLAAAAAHATMGALADVPVVRAFGAAYATTALLFVGYATIATIGLPLLLAGCVTVLATAETVMDAPRPWGVLVASAAATLALWSFFLVPPQPGGPVLR